MEQPVVVDSEGCRSRGHWGAGAKIAEDMVVRNVCPDRGLHSKQACHETLMLVGYWLVMEG